MKRHPGILFRDDHAFLQAPQLIALILHLAEKGAASLDSCVARLHALFEQAGEDLPLTPDEVRDRLRRNIVALHTARLIEPEGEGYRLTDRGREALHRHPLGMDRADLMEYPEYAAAVTADAQHGAGMDARQRSYDQGYAARRAGLRFTENPYTQNTVDHLAWENGWMEALDAPEDHTPS